MKYKLYNVCGELVKKYYIDEYILIKDKTHIDDLIYDRYDGWEYDVDTENNLTYKRIGDTSILTDDIIDDIIIDCRVHCNTNNINDILDKINEDYKNEQKELWLKKYHLEFNFN